MAVDRDKVLQTAQKLVERKRFDKAIVEYQKLVAEDPKDVRTLLKIGDLYLKTEEYVEAITTYERVGQFYSLQGFALKAIAVYKQIREIIHKHVPQYEDRFGHIVPRLAEIYTQLGLTSDALAAYDEVATRLLRAGRDRDAIDIFKRVVDLDPNNPLAYLRLAEALIRVRDYDGAIQRFGTAAELLLKLGRRDDALKVVERLLQHRPDARFARMAAEIYLDRGDPSDGMSALTKLQIAFKENPRDLETLALLARAFDLLGQPAKAIEVQKESARIAKEAGRVDQFTALISALVARAPNDEGVRQLAAQLVPSSRSTRASIDVEIDEDDEDDEDDEAEELEVEDAEPSSAAPIPLRASQPSTSPVASPRQLVAHAESLRRDRQYDKAIALLKGGVARLPGARELREKLCDILIEAGDQDGAVEQMLAFAQQLSGEGAVDDAARLLDEVLLLEPGNAQATEMLNLLGYAVPQEDELADEEHTGPEVSPTAGENDAYASEVPSQDLYDPDAPLPAYTLDEDGVVEALPRRPQLVTHLDDPFANEPPLPSFPIDDVEEVEDVEDVEPLEELEDVDDEEETASVNPSRSPGHPLAVAASQAPPAPSSMPPPPVLAAPPALYSPASGRPASVRPASARSVPPGSLRRADALDEDALEEVEFFAQHGMFEEARNILEEQLARLPNHPLLMERLREVTELASETHVARAATDNESGTRAVPRGSERPDEDRAFDIAESLKMIDELEIAPGSVTGVQDDPRQISVESVFEQFKAGVAAQISESDASTHYDLGVAYKEMGLYADAIAEFELAARDPGRECVCQSMIGVTHLQMGNIEAGIDALIRGLHASHKTVEQELALTYEIANAYEMRGVPEQALYYFQRVARMSPSYSDPRGSVAERLRRIDVPKPAARAVGAEMIADEFDAAFDDLLPSGKLP
ncbi:tetratricopeptide repeat protein [Sorangium sp. So ce1078]|uniref:tetratricopeptide repeat protein n=1 Tax=Sorangium sp. So ce1078 TaxID=3133329 RepID=UPI003F6481F6